MISKNINDIWILSKSGTMLYSQVQNPSLEDHLFGALMSALNTFVEQVANTNLTKFELGTIRYTISILEHKMEVEANEEMNEEFIFVATSSNKIKEDQINNQLQNIANLFFENFKSELKHWELHLDTFNKFGEILEKSLQDSIKNFQTAFW